MVGQLNPAMTTFVDTKKKVQFFTNIQAPQIIRVGNTLKDKFLTMERYAAVTKFIKANSLFVKNTTVYK